MSILHAISDIGLYRKINEDYAFCTSHPQDENVKLLLIADGMGGKNQGDVASQEVCACLEAWFYNEDILNLKNISGVYGSLEKIVQSINKYLLTKYGKDFLGTTLCMAIVGIEKTLVYNIGDSRCYIYKDKKLTQITEDDSGVWAFYKDGSVAKDDLRFFPTNNYITACVGLNEELCNSKFYIIPNDYSMLMMFTDGVTDILGDADLKHIIDKNEGKDILKEIIKFAVHGKVHLHVPISLITKYKTKFMVPLYGRDNASGINYIKD